MFLNYKLIENKYLILTILIDVVKACKRIATRKSGLFNRVDKSIAY